MTIEKQPYKIELILEADVSEEPVKDWILNSIKSSGKVVKVYTIDIKAINLDDAEYKFLEHFD